MSHVPTEREVTVVRNAVASMALVAALMLPGTAGSTTLLKFSLERMAKEASLVVQGHVAWDYSAQESPEAPIYTYTGIEVSRCIAGACSGTVTLKHRGGTVGGTTLMISGMPRFTPGDEVVLFLEPDPEGVPGMYYTVGMIQGFFIVSTEADTGAKTAVQQLGGVAIAEPVDGQIQIVSGVTPIVLPLEDLVSRVKAEWKKKAKGGGK
jgi:hypothetical protein